MIDQALVLLKNELQAYIDSKQDTVDVSLDNIGMLGIPEGKNLNNHVLITLVNIEEESTLKNSSAQKRPFANSALYENPPVFLNLYVLLSCCYADDDSGKNYQNALMRLSHIIRFFQSRNSFSVASSPAIGDVLKDDPDISLLKFTMELYTLTFEQINHLWGSLGGRQVPFAMYKLRLVNITERAIVREVPLITEIDITHHPITAK